MRAVVPQEFPPLPAGAVYWSRSTKRAGGMFHAHTMGVPVCGASVLLERHHSEYADKLSDMQYWGVCPRCYALSQKSAGVAKASPSEIVGGGDRGPCTTPPTKSQLSK